MTSIVYGLSDVAKDFYVEAYVYTNLQAPKQDLSGKVIIVTGASAGLGKESVRQLALMNPARIIMTGRNVEKAEKVRQDIMASTGYKKIVLERLDLCSMKSVCEFTERVKSQVSHVDVLMCNAGVGETNVAASRTGDGFDEMFQGNNLGHYLLLQKLLPLLRKAKTTNKEDARILFLSSLASKFTFSFDIHSYNNPSKMKGRDFYSTSKLMAVLMARGLAERFKDEFVINSVHPGTVKTEFSDKYSGFMVKYIFPVIYKLFERPLDQGAATQVYVASAPEAGRVTGEYWSNCQVWKMNPVAQNQQLCRQFCELCDELIRPWM